MTSDDMPCDSPSSVPEAVTETAETTKPKLMMRSAAAPIASVSRLSVKSHNRLCGNSRHSTVPTAIIAMMSVREVV